MSIGVAADIHGGIPLSAMSMGPIKRFAAAVGWVIAGWASEGKIQDLRLEQERKRQQQEQAIKEKDRSKKRGEGSNGGGGDKPPSTP
jgi:hypothetical protein